jgi:hypothetical protein
VASAPEKLISAYSVDDDIRGSGQYGKAGAAGRRAAEVEALALVSARFGRGRPLHILVQVAPTG